MKLPYPRTATALAITAATVGVTALLARTLGINSGTGDLVAGLVISIYANGLHEYIGPAIRGIAFSKKTARTKASGGPAPSADQPPRPPLNAETVLHFVHPDDKCDEMVGDLQERYTKKLNRIGKTRADWWYRVQVAGSVWPLFKAACSRAASATALNLLLFGLRLIGKADWADALANAAKPKRSRIT